MMNKAIKSILVLLLLLPAVGRAESFSTGSVVDTEWMEWIKGRWQIHGRNYVYEYTDEFVRRINGFIYYRFTVSQYPGMRNNMYAIFKSKKTGLSYFCRGYWHSRYGFTYTTSRIEFLRKDKFIVYSKDNPNEIFLEAVRLKRRGDGAPDRIKDGAPRRLTKKGGSRPVVFAQLEGIKNTITSYASFLGQLIKK